MTDETILLTDHQGRRIRLNRERRDHILEHPEMVGQFDRIREAISAPSFVIITSADKSVHVYHRFYEQTPVTRKYLQVAVKLLEDDAFVLTAYYSSRPKKGIVVWQA